METHASKAWSETRFAHGFVEGVGIRGRPAPMESKLNFRAFFIESRALSSQRLPVVENSSV